MKWNDVIYGDMSSIYSRDEIPWDLLDNKTVLITGANGMIASYLVYMLAFLKDHKVNVSIIAVVRSKCRFYDRFGAEFAKEYDVTIIESNMTAPFSCEQKVDYIIHAASIANPQKYVTNPVEVIEPNILGTYHLLKLAISHCSDGFLLFSTGDVYGSVDNPSLIHESTVGKVDQLEEHSCYGESKRMAEALCMAFYREYTVPIKIARIGHTYGPTVTLNEDPRVFSSMIKCVIEGSDIVMYSNGLSKRPFCYLADAIAAYFLLLLKGNAGEAYNVCNSDEFLSIKEFAEIIADISGKKVVFQNRDCNDTYLANNVNIDNNPVSNKLKSLGWKPHYSTRFGLERTITYLMGNSGYEKN